MVTAVLPFSVFASSYTITKEMKAADVKSISFYPKRAIIAGLEEVWAGLGAVVTFKDGTTFDYDFLYEIDVNEDPTDDKIYFNTWWNLGLRASFDCTVTGNVNVPGTVSVTLAAMPGAEDWSPDYRSVTLQNTTLTVDVIENPVDYLEYTGNGPVTVYDYQASASHQVSSSLVGYIPSYLFVDTHNVVIHMKNGKAYTVADVEGSGFAEEGYKGYRTISLNLDPNAEISDYAKLNGHTRHVMDFTTTQNTEKWTGGNTYPVNVTYMGKELTYYVQVIETEPAHRVDLTAGETFELPANWAEWDPNDIGFENFDMLYFTPDNTGSYVIHVTQGSVKLKENGTVIYSSDSYWGDPDTMSSFQVNLVQGHTYNIAWNMYGEGHKIRIDYEGVTNDWQYKTSAPKLVSATNIKGGITVKWNALTGAEGYMVYRKTASSGWTLIASGMSATSYTDTKAAAGTQYTYTVKAYRGSTNSKYDTTGLTTVRLTNPAFKVANAKAGVNVTWGKVAGAKGYYVYRKAGSGSYSKIATTTALSYVDKTAKSGTTYTYAVRAYNGSVLSAFNAVSVIRLANTTTKLANQTAGIKVSWTKVTGAKGYYVYRKTGSGSYSRIATTTSLSYVDKTAKAGTKYTYAVRAYNGKTLSAFTAVSIVRLTTPTVKLANTKSGPKATWGKVAGAKGYYVYRKTANGSYTKIATIKSGATVSYVDKTAKNGVKYYYIVKAYNGSYISGYAAKGITCKK